MKRKEIPEIRTVAHNSSLVWRTKPREGEWESRHYHKWRTECRSYVIYRVRPKDGSQGFFMCAESGLTEGERQEWALDHDLKLGYGHPVRHPDLRSAVDSVENYHRAKCSVHKLRTNREQLLSLAVKLGLEKTGEKCKTACNVKGASLECTVPEIARRPEDKGEDRMRPYQIERGAARGLLKQVGFRLSEEASDKKIVARLYSIADLSDADYRRVNRRYQDYLQEILEAVESDRQIVVVDDSDEDSYERKDRRMAEKKIKKKAVVVASSNGNGHAKGKKSKGTGGGGGYQKQPTDKFGIREGTVASRLASVLSKKPQTKEEIEKAAGLTSTNFKPYMQRMAQRGHVKILEATEERYQLA